MLVQDYSHETLANLKGEKKRERNIIEFVYNRTQSSWLNDLC